MQRARRTPPPEEPKPQAPVAPSREAAKSDPDNTLDWADVPAAVVCAFCGRPECGGCMAVDEPTNASGVVAIVPWERPGLGWITRLWATARLATLSHRELFASLPEGPVRAPFEFAVLSELVAAAGVAIGVVGALALVPEFATTAVHDPVVRQVLLRVVACGVPGLTGLMILLHTLHGVLVDRAARLAGSRKRGRGLRFGLYACGWDLVTLPIGLLVVAVTEGFTMAKRAAGLALSIPSQATRAYLTGVHALDPESARKAASRANAETGVGALGLLLAVGVALAFVLR
ncbi:MAG TPA: hypothetical protein VMI54_27805 [Polyangiaceae bacterium]|nr:hypothetical protein [Polyangiaceae bacterium]